MKKFVFIIASIASLSVTSTLFAQDCSQYMFMKKNKIIESTSYNEKGNVLGKSVSTVTNITTTNGVTTATVSSEFFDKSGKSSGKKNASYKCDGGKLMMDMGPGNQPGNMKFNISYIEYPAGMKVGDHLNGANVQLEEKVGGKTIVATSNITDRKVVGKENITTPAGTWNCLKITYKNTTVVKGFNMPPQVIESTEWFVPNFGIIKIQLMGMITEITGLR